MLYKTNFLNSSSSFYISFCCLWVILCSFLLEISIKGYRVPLLQTNAILPIILALG